MSEQVIDCNIMIIGGGMGGVAAALAVAESDLRVVLTEPTDWLGGQMTSQGVSAFDEHLHIETFGGTRAYYRLRESIRAHYRERYHAPPTMPDGTPLNPGNGWVSRLCFEPCVGVAVIQQLLAPHVESKQLTILLRHEPIDAVVDGDRIVEVRLRGADRKLTTIRAAYFLDATELGDLLPLAGAEYVTGTESRADTGEPHAPDHARPDEVQGFTYGFVVEHRPGENHTIPPPHGYDRFRATQPYTLTLRGHHGEPRPFMLFEIGPTGLPPFWTYRRIFDGALLDPSGERPDRVLINWPGNDYHAANIIDRSPDEQARILDEAKRLALGFLHWLQTEAPRDDGGRGYPGLRLVPDAMDTQDGLSKAPYIRESRRIRAVSRIVEQDIAAVSQPGARARPMRDSVGVGWYHIDLHDCVGSPTSMYEPTRPFQIPLGALIPQRITNLIAACKNIGTTHLTNGAYRLHPIEWNIGEAAGALAAFCVEIDQSPQAVHAEDALLRRLQWRLLQRGVPLAWSTDVADGTPLFAAVQLLIVLDAIVPGSDRDRRLEIRLDEPVSSEERAALYAAARSIPGVDRRLDLEAMSGLPETWGQICATIAPLIAATLDRSQTIGRGAARGCAQR